jgi:hypothetical protein
MNNDKNTLKSLPLGRFQARICFARISRRILLIFLAVVVGFSPYLAYGVPPHPDVPGQANAPAKGGKAAKAVGAPQAPSVNRTLIFNDAVTLKEWIEEGAGNNANIWGLLKTYHVTQANIGQNPFLKNVVFPASVKGEELGNVKIGGTNTLQGANTTNPFSASSVADALGSLIAQRFKEEAELVALQQLARYMKQIDSTAERQPLTAALPRTMGYLRTFDDPDNLDLKDWAVLQSDFKADLVAWPENLPAFLDTQFTVASRSDRRYFVLMAVTAAGQIIKHGRSPYDIIDGLEVSSAAFIADPKHTDPLDPTVESFDIGLNLVAIVSHMLTKDGMATWHSASDVESLLGLSSITKIVDGADTPKKYNGINLLLGLSFANDAPLYTKIDSWLDHHHQPTLDKWNTSQWDSMAKMLDGLAGAFDTLHRDTLAIPYPAGTVADLKPLIDDVGSIGNAICAQVNVFVSIDSSAATTAIDEVSQRLDAFVSIVGDVKAKAYPAAIGETIAFLHSYGNQAKSDPALAFLEQAGPFIADVASAKTATDTETALQTYALPAGSYTQKQREAFSVTLNGYFGITTGAETLLGGLQGTGTARTRWHLGFAAPVGLDFNWGQNLPESVDTSGAEKNGGFFQTGAWSLFVPVVDVGAVASWRLGSGGGQVSSVTWSNIVAPGLYVVWAKKGSPFSIMFGAQYGPELTKVSTGGGNTIERAALQFPSIQFTFDIPIFNLYQTTSTSSAAMR